MSTPTAEWHKTACILCSINCGIEVQLDGRRFARIRGDKAHPASRGVHLREGAAARPLPERARSADHAAAPAAGRRLRADRLGHRDPRDRRRSWCAFATRTAATTHLLLRRRRTGESPRRRLLRRRPAARSARSTRSNALAQEKTGEFWVDGQLFGRPRCHTTGDFEHAEVAVFVGKNPWQSHGFPRARATLRAIAADPARTLIVIDPRRTETAELADYHLQVRPGTDAFLLSAAAGGAARRGPDRPRVPRRARGQRRPRCSSCCAPCRSPTTARAPASPRISSAPSRAASPAPPACRSTRTSASSRRRTAR